ncbi:MAG: hypothetical protein ABSH15_12065 [Verrucomicrobiota bacterium]|jgi:hypothetical protein
MQISFKPTRQNKSANALLIVMCFLVASLLVFGSLLYWVSSNSKVTMDNEQFISSEYAAEAAVENVLSYMDKDFLSQSFQPASSYATNLPPTNGWPVMYTFSDTNGNAGRISVYYSQPPAVMTNLGSAFSSLYGLPQNCQITATATPTNAPYIVPATVSLTFEAASIPVFQFAIFYNVDLDISPGSAMTIGGKTFSNGNIWIDPPAQVTFNDTVTCAGNYKLQSDPNGEQTGNVTASPVTPIYNFTGNGGQPLSHADAIVLPIGANSMTNNNATNVEAILQPPPPAYAPGTAAAYSTNGLVYDLNAADLIISNNIYAATNGTNIYVIYQNQFCGSIFQTVAPDATNIVLTTTNPTTHVVTPGYTNKYFSYVTNVTFYDFRESDTNYAIQIDIGKLNTWFNNTTTTGGSNYNIYNNSGTTSKGHYINGIYVYNYIPVGAATLPCVRVINGKQLPSAGLSIATPGPLYVEGDYNVQTATSAAGASAQTHNTAYTYPAAFLADAITILSSKWNDTGNAYTNGGSYSSRNAASTTINAACVEGIVVSTNFTGAPAGGCYSGGVENFLRLEENWSGDTLCYNGSIIVLFPSIYATNYWQMPGAYYGVPTRSWAFDTNYLSQTRLPPMTPQFKKIIRQQWTGY